MKAFKFDLAVLGLGYVGLPLAIEATNANLKVMGYDVNSKLIENLNIAQSHVEDISNQEVKKAIEAGLHFSTNSELLSECKHLVISVPTPLTDYQPDLSYVENASKDIASNLQSEQIVILESTTYPGTTLEVVKPILESISGLEAGKDFMLGYSPERIDPGNQTWNFKNTPKIVSGVNEESTTANQHVTVSDADLPKEKELPEAPVVAPPPEASPAVAFDLPTESRRKRKSGKKNSSLSISAVMKDMERQENEPAEPLQEKENSLPKKEEGPQSVFTEHELKTALAEYSNQRHIKTAIRSMLQAQLPKIIDKNTLEITVDNNIQQGYFNDEQKELVPWLRKKLDNFALRFEVKMSENVQAKKLYMPEEKFKHMAEKNPNLLYLREKLNTDLE